MAWLPITVVPDPNDARARQAWIDAVAGTVSLRMLLDTGTFRSAIPQRANGTTLLVDHVSSGRGLSGAAGPNQRATLGGLSAGPIRQTDMVVDIQDAERPHPPLLGRDVFQHHRCDFQFSNGGVEIDPVDDPVDLATWGTWGSSDAPGVELRWGDTAVRAVWDTGAGITIVDRTWAERHPEAITILQAEDHGTDVTGASVTGVRGQMASYAVGDLGFPEQQCGVVDLSDLNAQLTQPINMLLGLPQIELADWYLDFPERRLGAYLSPATSSGSRQSR
ncbi:aspartyl protease family protein [Kribbella sp. NPDC059898]|uniref:aspartyl protease family protein n=1 Tax=Kribbella sp. NPDC059898 TaxID=3346995 RepID=UPI003652CCA5